MLFDMMSDPANSVLRGLTIPEGKGATWGQHVSDKPNIVHNCDFGYEGPISLKTIYLDYRKVGHNLH